ncbi:MAG TPA: DUF3488 and transglutaminase-like domain-containing protein [Steroidobacteraceae bacterium]|jgi:transglutaminase-like putative cysteine protease
MSTPAASIADAEELPPHAVWLLLAGFLAAVLLNADHMALWCLPLAIGAVAWRVRALRAAPRWPARYLRAGGALLLTVAVLIGFHTLNGIQAGSSLLASMAALKLTETTRRRDWLIVSAAALFMLLSACLGAQSLWRVPLYAAELWLLCAGLYALGAGREAASTALLFGHAGRTLLAASPLALLLFLFVPRLPGSFWVLPQEHTASTGLGDEMNPGSISELTQSNEPALRVRFDGPLPPPAQRYWRGPVLHDFDGYAWRRRHGALSAAEPLQFQGQSYSYEVSLEPNENRVLIALELPQGLPQEVPNSYLTFDYQLIAPTAIDRAISYRLQSSPHPRQLQPLAEDARRLDLQLPANRNPRSIALAHALRSQAGSDAGFVRAVLDHLRHGGFTYTLEPPLLTRDSIDDLLFNTRQGFCGHYASAFVMLMRAGGVPARVVTGYLGGTWNRFGGYLYITQSDAHAWAEVWLDGQGWARVDPTAVVAPGRLTEELDELLPGVAGTGQRLLELPVIVDLVQLWQGLNARWQDDFIGFNLSKQLRLLDRLGIRQHQMRTFALLLAASAALWLALISWGVRPRGRARAADSLSRSWRTLERKLRRVAPARAPYEAALNYAERVGRARPDLASTVQGLARRYAQLRYGPARSAADCQRFRRAVRSLRAPPRA